MRKEYDLSKLKFKKNPYAKRLKKQITIRLDSEIIDYFSESLVVFDFLFMVTNNSKNCK